MGTGARERRDMTTTCDKCGQPRSDGISEEERAALAAAKAAEPAKRVPQAEDNLRK